MVDPLGVYISIPFCRSKCTYCNFASGVYPASEHTRYVDRVIADLCRARAWADAQGAELPREVDTIYLGGGTPSLLDAVLFEKLFTALHAEFTVLRDTEITVECAPAQLSEETLQAMVRVGVNRASLGVQSFVDAEARASGRLHTRASTLETIARLRTAGVTNLNVDLIAGLAGQTEDSWEESLDSLVNTGVSHASVYMLEVDEDSRLGREVLAGGARYSAGLVPSDEAITRMYTRAIERLQEAGLCQYEISNFARAGFESRHNLRYWQRRPYLGLGLDASSALRAGASLLRTTTTDDLKSYLEAESLTSALVLTERLTKTRQREEAWFLGLRTHAGVSLESFEREFGADARADAMSIVERLCADGLMEMQAKQVRLTAHGRLLSNEVFQEFLEEKVESE